MALSKVDGNRHVMKTVNRVPLSSQPGHCARMCMQAVQEGCGLGDALPMHVFSGSGIGSSADYKQQVAGDMAGSWLVLSSSCNLSQLTN